MMDKVGRMTAFVHSCVPDEKCLTSAAKPGVLNPVVPLATALRRDDGRRPTWSPTGDLMGAQTCVLPTYHASNKHRVQENIDSIVTWPSAIGRDCRTAAGNNVLHAEAAPRAT